MKQYCVRLKSTTPLLCNVRQRKIELELRKLKKNELADWEENNWQRKAEIDKKGNVIIPSRWFRSAFINACKFSRLVPHFETRKTATYTRYAESLIWQNSDFLFEVKNLKPYGAYVGAQGAGSKTKIWRIRPQIDSWESNIEMVDPFEKMSVDELKELLEYCGMLVGVGDGRNLNFGRFEVVSIK